MSRFPVRPRRGFTYIESLIVVAVLGILAAIALPNFHKFQTRARQAEAKANLTAWYTAELSFFQEENRFTESVQALGFSPERGNRYAYYFGYSQSCVTRTAAGESPVRFTNNCIAVDLGAHPNADPTPLYFLPTALTFSSGSGYDPGLPGLGPCGGSNCNISAFAVGDIDDEDVGLDTWWISTKSATQFEGKCGSPDTSAPAGVPVLVNDDVTCD